MAATFKHKESLDDWGSDSLAAMITMLCRRAGVLIGIDSTLVLEGVTGEDLARIARAGPAVLTIVPHGAFLLGSIALHMGRLRLDKRVRPLRTLAAADAIICSRCASRI